MIQIVNFPTLSRTVGNLYKHSVIYHIYVTDPTVIKNSDALAITIYINMGKMKDLSYWKRDWRKYSKDNILCFYVPIVPRFSQRHFDSIAPCWVGSHQRLFHAPPMHPPMYRPMHGPACPLTQTPIQPHLTEGHQSYMILLLHNKT